MSLESLVRRNIWNLRPYASARSEFKGQADVFLDANENPFETGLNRYPDPLQVKVKEKISQLKGIPADHIFLGNGSDEAIDLLIRVFCEPRIDHILTLPPTYGMYQVSADIADVEVRTVSLTPDFQPDVPAILDAADAHSKVLFVCSPNNPTGNSVDPALVQQLADQFAGILVIDEAYIDFADQLSFSAMVQQYPRLVVMQTFSKAWGMAGIRLGMAFAQPELIHLLNKVKPPYNVNQLSQEAALNAMDKVADKERMVQSILEQRFHLQDQLKAYSFVRQIYPSDANFLLVKVDQPLELYNYLVAQKIIVRNRSSVHLCNGSLRISIGTPEENDRLLHSLTRFEADLLHSIQNS